MIRKLSRLGWTALVLIALLVLLALNSLARDWGYAFLGDRLPFFLDVAFVTLLIKLLLTPLTRRLVWRVRNRLLVTYFLVGVVPLVLLIVMAALGTGVLLGSTMSYIARAEFNRELEQLAEAAQDRAQSATGRASIVEGPLQEIPSWSKPGLKGIVRMDSHFFLAAHAEAGIGPKHAEVFKSIAFDDAALARMTSGFGMGLFVGLNSDGRNVEIDEAQGALLDSSRVQPGVKPQGLWDFGATGVVPLTVRSFETGANKTYVISLFARPTTVLTALLTGMGPSISRALIVLLQTLAGVFIVVGIVAIASSVQLTRSLTRTIHDLDVGTKQVQSGDFSQRIPIRGEDQLNELAGSFNIMTHRVERLIVEVKEKQKLDAELEIAREVQAQLFPRNVPVLKTLELAGFCNPARTVSGDYYDFIPMESGLTALVLGDISGKGISAALLMASLQSSLRAQLAVRGKNIVSTAELVSQLSRQLYENTLPEKYATLYCGVYDDKTRRLLYTNAGHLPPILLRGDTQTRLEATGTVVGIFPYFPFGQDEMVLQPGDLLAAYTDGITEAEDQHGEQFGEARLIELLSLHRDKPLADITKLVTDHVREWAHDPDNQDDTTMLLARGL